MFVLSKLLPKFLKKKYEDDGKMPCLGEKPKDYQFRVLLLDDSDVLITIKSNVKGQVVLEKVFDHLNLLERDYFGLRYLDGTNQTHWLDCSKSVGGQFKGGNHHTLYFGVKFYAADPCKLHEEITRYQFFLQIKRDILQGRLPISFEVGSELCAFAVQSELGDYDPKRHSYGYISEFRFIPNQTEEFETRIMHIHRQLAGQVPSVAEYKFLDKVKWLEMYGVDLHPAQGEGSIEYFVGLTPIGVVIYKNKNKVGSYFWPRITKITFKDKSFMIRVKDKNNDENTYAFECTSKQACKHLWKCCVEHHAFFRLSQAQNSITSVGRVFSLGSKHRFRRAYSSPFCRRNQHRFNAKQSGRTEKQVSTESLYRPEPKVVRTPSKRHQRRLSSESLPNGHMYYPDEDHIDGPITTVVTPEPVKTPSSQRKDYTAQGDSPRSTRSAPWQTMKGGMYTSGRESPLSVRSEKMMFPNRRAQSGSDGEGGGYHKKRRSRKAESDYDSDASQRRNRRRHRDREHEGGFSGTESEPGYRHKRHHSRRSEANSVYSDMHQRPRDSYPVHDNMEKNIRTNGSVASMPGSEASQQSRRRRRRSRSPGNKKPPEELAQHFKYIEPEPGMSEDQLRDIPYTTVETENPFRHKSPHERRRHKSSRRRSYGENLERAGERVPSEEAPPPYTSYNNRRSLPELHHKNPDPYRSGSEISDMVRPPVSAYRNQAHTAPIVKTKPSTGQQYQNVKTSYSHMPASLPARMPNTSGRQDRSINQHDQTSHSKEDSGLGFDQDYNTSSMSGMQQYSGHTINGGHQNYPNHGCNIPTQYPHQTRDPSDRQEQPPAVPPYPSVYNSPSYRRDPGFYSSPHPLMNHASPLTANHLHHPAMSPNGNPVIRQAMNSSGTNRDIMTEL